MIHREAFGKLRDLTTTALGIYRCHVERLLLYKQQFKNTMIDQNSLLNANQITPPQPPLLLHRLSTSSILSPLRETSHTLPYY